MKEEMPEEFRCEMGSPNSALRYLYHSEPGEQRGTFWLPRPGKKTGQYFFCLVSSGMGWDHISVSIPAEKRCPTWEEMCYVKEFFFHRNECVVQFHPKEKDYVNMHEHCLHLWRCQTQEFPTPDPLMVGI